MIQAEPPVVLDEIVVTAARLPPAEGEAAFSVVRLGVEELTRVQRLDDALTATPAVSLFRRAGSAAANPTTQGISLRAIAPSGAGRALVTLDGVPMNDPFGGWVIWSQLSPDAVESIDIVRGAGAGPYGAGALTGVIVMRERDSGAAIDLSAAERGGARASAAATVGETGYDLFLSALAERTDGYAPVRGAAAGAADTPLDMRSLAASGRLDARMAGGASLSLRLGLYDEARGSGLAGATAEARGTVISATAARPAEAGYGWRVQVWRRTSDFSNTSYSVAADRGSTALTNDQYETPATAWGANLALRRSTGALQWELGADARLNEGETRERNRFQAGAPTRERRAGGETSVTGVYLEGAWREGPWLVAGGLRADAWRNSGGRRLEFDLPDGAITLDERSPDASGEVLTGRLAVRRALADGLAVRAAAYSGFRPPTINELHRPFRVGNDVTEANPDLVPERLHGLEAGLSGGGARADWTVTGFWNRLEDAIVNVTIGEGPATFPRAGFVPAGGVLRQRRNAGAVEAFGLEAQARWRPSDRLTLTGALALTDARVDGGADAPQLTGLRPAQAPKISAAATIEWWAADRLDLGAVIRHEGRRFDDDLNSRVLGAATSVDARATWRLGETAAVYLAVDNVTDARIETSETGLGVEGYAAPRTARVGLRLTY